MVIARTHLAGHMLSKYVPLGNRFVRHYTTEGPQQRVLHPQMPWLSPTTAWIAGGWVGHWAATGMRNDTSDIDVFGTAEGLEQFVSRLRRQRDTVLLRELNGVLEFEVKWHYLPIQVIIGYPDPSPEATLDRFDLSPCRAALWNGGGLALDTWEADCRAGVMRLNEAALALHKPEAILARILKYQNRDYIYDTATAKLLDQLAPTDEERLALRERAGKLLKERLQYKMRRGAA